MILVDGHARELEAVDPRLLEVVEFMVVVAWLRWKQHLRITSIKRNDGSTHSTAAPYRFMDLSLMDNGDNETLRAITNKAFQYDEARPKMETVPPLRHASVVSGKITPAHFHVQVKPS